MKDRTPLLEDLKKTIKSNKQTNTSCNLDFRDALRREKIYVLILNLVQNRKHFSPLDVCNIEQFFLGLKNCVKCDKIKYDIIFT